MSVVNEMKLVIKSLSKNVSLARVSVSAFAAQLDPKLPDVNDVKTAVSEAVTNSIIHGYDDSKGDITILCRLYNNKMEINIIDEGKGIEDIDRAREPLYTSKPEMDRSGMGFTIMETFMDSLDIKSDIDKGTIIKMTKYFNK